MNAPLDGSLVALPTPFCEGEVDFAAFRGLLERHAAHDTRGVVVAGTTGEAPSLSENEWRHLMHAAVEIAGGRLSILAGAGTSSTATTVERARFAAASGVDALLIVTPPYVRPSRAGLASHFGAVAEAVGIPIVLYNVPTRTGVDLDPDLAREIGERHANVVAIKECTSSAERIARVVETSGLAVLCGEDSRIAAFGAAGAAGAINVVGNVLPDETAALVEAARPGGDTARAAALERQLAPLVAALFRETNPVPVKAALAHLGLCSESVRGPLAPLEERSRTELEAALRALAVSV